MEIAVIGCGPAGLAAAHAAIGLGAQVRIFAPKKKTSLRGPVMLHHPIPGINNTQPDGYVKQIVIGGSILDYRLKLYGDVNIAINGDILDPGFHTWRLPEAYDEMWDLYSSLIVQRMVKPYEVDLMTLSYDLVISTAPVRALCLRPAGHIFRSVPVAIVPRYSYPNQPKNTVIYNSYEHIKWVRSSRIFDAEVTEYKPEDAPDDAMVIHKPISTTCDCHPRVLRTGRFGSWTNEVWIDTAYYAARSAVYSMQHQHEWNSVT